MVVAAVRRLELTRLAWARALLRSRWPQFLGQAVALAGLIFAILAGLLGSPVGSNNFAILFVWIAWWTALKLLFIPLGGRAWCSICPIPMPGEWLQRGGVLEPGRKLGLGWRWPRRLRGAWLQSGGFVLVGLFSAVTLTTPRLTAWVLLGILLLALVMSLVFKQRAFCSYLCPIGGFTGLYASMAPVELRVKDRTVCAAHNTKTCYHNCPWGVYPLALKRNTHCGLCMECLRVCPEDNLALNLRPFGADLAGDSRQRLDETFLALVMLGSVLIYAAVFLGPWGTLKTAAYQIGSGPWLGYSLAFVGIVAGVLPLLFGLAVWGGWLLSGRRRSLKQTAARQGQALLPLGLAQWMAFTVAFAFPKAGYLVPLLSDPFGWGWKLLGGPLPNWGPDLTVASPWLQAAILMGGLFWAGRTAATAGRKESFTVLGFCLTLTLLMLWLLIG